MARTPDSSSAEIAGNTPSDRPAPMRACCERGLIYPDRHRACSHHTTADNRELVATLDRQAKPILGRQKWPYGADIDVGSRQRLVGWAQRYGLKLAKTSCSGLHWLDGERCPSGGCRGGLGRWADHVTRWTFDGRPALLLAQPYSINNDHLITLGALAARDDLDVHVGNHGWYGYRTIEVAVWRANAYQNATHRAMGSRVLETDNLHDA